MALYIARFLSLSPTGISTPCTPGTPVYVWHSPAEKKKQRLKSPNGCGFESLIFYVTSRMILGKLLKSHYPFVKKD